MENKTIKLTNLSINVDNPRYESQKSQKAAIEMIVLDQRDKLFNLASDIIEHGLNPLDMILVTPIDANRYLVLEGNRRVTAMKLLQNPQLINDDMQSLRKRFEKLIKGKDVSMLKAVKCVVIEDQSEANLWIKRKHAGQLDGRGTVSWDSLQIQRFEARSEGKASEVLQIVDLLLTSEMVSSSFKSKLSSINTTNLDRLISDPDVRKRLGISKNKGQLVSSFEQHNVIDGLVKIIDSITSPDFSVKKIYNKEKRKQFIEELGIDVQSTNKTEITWMFSETENENNKETEVKATSSIKKKINNNQRASLIPNKFQLPIENPRISQIFTELKCTSMRSSPNAVSVLFRVFLELTIDSFLNNHGLAKDGHPASEEQNLIGKCSRVMNYLYQKNLISKEKLKGIQNELKDSTSIFSIESLNAYVHNMHFSPKEDNLRIGWDNVEPFFEAVWGNMNPEE